MNLGVSMTSRCNAACRHCSTSCGPSKTTTLDTDDVLRVVSEAVELGMGQPLRLVITGGEPFLDLTRLRHVIEHAGRLGVEVACVSNGYWATSDAKAVSILADLKSLGLSRLALSVSRYHSEFVKIQRVRRAVLAARSTGIRSSIKCALTQEDSLHEQLPPSWLDFADLADEVEYFRVIGPGRDDAPLAPSDLFPGHGLPLGPCPSEELVVREDGRVRVCGSASALNGFHEVGSIAEQPIAILYRRAAVRGKFQILREHGPIAMAREIIARGLGTRLRDNYASVCELCSDIARDSELAAIAEELGEAREIEQLKATMSATLYIP
ncbi:MAG: radical SAM protein [Panacagrimonas sp.]